MQRALGAPLACAQQLLPSAGSAGCGPLKRGSLLLTEAQLLWFMDPVGFPLSNLIKPFIPLPNTNECSVLA